MTSATMRRPRDALVAVASGGTPRVYRPGCGPLSAPIRVRPVRACPCTPRRRRGRRGRRSAERGCGREGSGRSRWRFSLTLRDTALPVSPSEVAAPAAAASWRRGGRGREGEAVLWSGEAVFWSGRVRVIQVVVQPDSSRHTYAWLAL